VALPLVGCSGKSKGPKDSVSGKVTLNDKPVSGTVHFVYGDNKDITSPIAADGSYLIPNPPPGNVKIVVTPAAGVAGGGLVGGPQAKDVPLPEMDPGGGATKGEVPPKKYQDAKTTDLTYEVQSGKQTFDIQLKP